MRIFNGVYNRTLFKGLDDELEVTSESNLFRDEYTNGMQFEPNIYKDGENHDVLPVFDPSQLMFSNFTRTDYVSETSHGIDLVRYALEDEFNGQDVSLAYTQPY